MRFHCTHSILLQNISTGLELFWDDFPPKKFRVRPGPTTHFHTKLGFFEFFLCKAPERLIVVHIIRNRRSSLCTCMVSVGWCEQSTVSKRV